MAQATQERERADLQQSNGREPEGPTKLGVRSWFGVLKRTGKEFSADNLTDWAAALTYYAVLAIFPALIALVSILGLIGQSATQPLLDNLTELTPGAANDIITNAIHDLTRTQSTAGLAFVIGLAGALWSASGYVGAFPRAATTFYGVEGGPPFGKRPPPQIAAPAVLLLLLVVSSLAVVVPGPIAEQLGDLIGVGSTAVT